MAPWGVSRQGSRRVLRSPSGFTAAGAAVNPPPPTGEDEEADATLSDCAPEGRKG